MPKANAHKARSAGELDQTFAHSGLQTLRFPAARKTIGKSVAVLPSGDIMVSTTVIDASGASHYGLTRLLADGHLDTSFGEGGDGALYAVGFNSSNGWVYQLAAASPEPTPALLLGMGLLALSLRRWRRS